MFEYIHLKSKVAKHVFIMAHVMDFMTGDVYVVPISILSEYYCPLPLSEKKY